MKGKPTTRPVDAVNPAHYRSGAIETIDLIVLALGKDGAKAFCHGNAIKYRMRAGKKSDALEDIKKAEWYEQFAEHLDGEGDDPRVERGKERDKFHGDFAYSQLLKAWDEYTMFDNDVTELDIEAATSRLKTLWDGLDQDKRDAFLNETVSEAASWPRWMRYVHLEFESLWNTLHGEDMLSKRAADEAIERMRAIWHSISRSTRERLLDELVKPHQTVPPWMTP